MDQLKGSEKGAVARKAETFKTRNLQARVLLFEKEMFLTIERFSE